MKKHTPGPWELQDHRKGVECWTIAAPNRCYVVAELDCDHDEAEANARLIVAGPELLELAELCREVIDADLDNEPSPHSLGNLNARLKAIIAKAKGS